MSVFIGIVVHGARMYKCAHHGDTLVLVPSTKRRISQAQAPRAARAAHHHHSSHCIAHTHATKNTHMHINMHISG
jgi:hypothetical protein